MKWLGLAFILFTVVALTGWLRTNPRGAKWAWGLLTFLPFVLDPLHLIIAPFATPMWSGYVKGWEISLLDAVAFGIIFGTRGRWPRMVLVLPLLAYIGAVLLAVLQARFPSYAFSYPLQLIRVLLVFLAVARVAQLEDGERALLTGLVLGIAVQAGYAIMDRANGVFQTGGSLGHQNLLGFVSHLALMPLCGMFLARRLPLLAAMGIACALVAVVLTGSRATILLAGAGLTMTLLLSTMLRFSGQKIGYVVGAFLLLAASAPLAYSAIERRVSGQMGGVLEKDQQRIAFERTAKLMVQENPMGVGPNHYVFMAITEGYAERAGVNWATGNRAAQVHHSYLLVAAETGYLGVAALIVLLGTAIWRAFSTAIRFRKYREADILLGLGVGLVAISLHALVEWTFTLYAVQYVFAGSLGLIVGLRSRLISRALSTDKKPKRAVAAVKQPAFASAMQSA
ncbi:O-antigen ligase family protein [Sphingomonas sp. LHG3443-2]|uniref:O-antigen ligase family protein n=1 Tax=Sphingomonas sp. LHG3443-2 TaxID=2804639 RepID=UPI003CF4BC9D